MMKIRLLLLCLITLVAPGYGQLRYFELGEKSFVKGLYELAVLNYQRALGEVGSGSWAKVEGQRPLSKQQKKRARYRLGMSHFQLKQYVLAEKQLAAFNSNYLQDKKKLLSPTLLENYFWGNYYQLLAQFEQGKTAVALEGGLRAVQEFSSAPEVAKLHLLLGELAAASEQWELAEESLKQVENNPSGGLQEEAKYLRGVWLLKRKQPVAAEAALLQVRFTQLKFFEMEEAVINTIALLVEKKRYSAAYELVNRYQASLKTEQKQRELAFLKARLLALRGKTAEAILAFEELRKTSARLGLEWSLKVGLELAATYEAIKQDILAASVLQELLAQMRGTSRLEEAAVFYYEKVYLQLFANYEKQEQDKALETLVTELKLVQEERVGTATARRLHRFAAEKDLTLTLKLGLKKSSRAKENPKAFLAFSNALASRVNYYEAQVNSGKERHFFYLQLGRRAYQKAAYWLSSFFWEKAEALDSNSEVLFLLGESELALENPRKALHWLKKVEEQLVLEKESATHPANAQARLLLETRINDALGFASFQTGQLEAAVRYYEANLGTNQLAERPTELLQQAHFYLGESWRLKQDYSAAQHHYKKFTALQEKTVSTTKSKKNQEKPFYAFYHLGRIAFLQLQDAAEGIALFQKAIAYAEAAALAPALRARGVLALAQLYIDQEQPEKALLELGQLEKASGAAYYEALFLMGKLSGEAAAYEQALSYYYELINSAAEAGNSPDLVARAYFERGLIKLRQQSPLETLFLAKQLKKLFPKHEEAERLRRELYLSTADYYYSIKRYRRMVEVYEELLENGVTQAMARFVHRNLAVGYSELEAEEKSLAHFQRVTELSEELGQFDNDYFEGLFAVATLSYKKGQKRLAADYFRRIAKAPQAPAALKKKAATNLLTLTSPVVSNSSASQQLRSAATYLARYNKEKKPQLLNDALQLIAPISPESEVYVKALLLKLKLLKAQLATEEALELGLKIYYDFKAQLSKSELAFLYYTLSTTLQRLGYEKDSNFFLKELKEAFPNSAYLKKLTAPVGAE